MRLPGLGLCWILSGLGLSFGMKFDAQGRLIAPAGGSSLSSIPLPDDEEDIDDDEAQASE